jgi:hypothetical protein
VWKLLDKLKPDLSCMILLSHSCMYVPKGMWASTQQIFTPGFTAAVFTRAMLWNQPKCPRSNGWIEQMW